jgi:hypothetical protein
MPEGSTIGARHTSCVLPPRDRASAGMARPLGYAGYFAIHTGTFRLTFRAPHRWGNLPYRRFGMEPLGYHTA